MITKKRCLMGFAVVCFGLGLLSCGGGGGGGGGSSTAITYTGDTGKAAITATNALSILQNAWYMGRFGFDLTEVPLSGNEQPLASNLVSSVAPPALITVDIPGDCGGYAELSIYDISANGDFTGEMVFLDNFCVDGVIWFGSSAINGSVDVVTEDMEYLRMTLTDITLMEGSDSLTFTEGVLTYRIDEDYQGEKVNFEAVIKNNNNNKTYWINNYELKVEYGINDMATVTGRFYDYDHGYVDISTQSDLIISDIDGIISGVLFISGQNSSAILIFSENNHTTLEVDADNDGVYEITIPDPLSDNGTSTPVYGFGFTALQYRVYEKAAARYQAYLAMTKDSQAIQDADIDEIRMYDSGNNVITATNGGFSAETYMYLNCMVTPCSESGPLNENGFYGSFLDLPADTYSFDVDTFDGQTLNLNISYPGQLVLPIVLSSTMQSAWNGNDLVLSWTNPVGSMNWADVDQLRIKLFDSVGTSVLYIRLGSTATTVTIDGSLLNQAVALGNGILGVWEVQTRAYDSNEMNFARGYSNRVNIVAPYGPPLLLGGLEF